MNAKVFWSRVERTRRCWLWRGTVGSRGYSICYVEGRQWLAHRLPRVGVMGAEEIAPSIEALS